MNNPVLETLLETLTPIYGKREAENICKYILPEAVKWDKTQQEDALRRLSRSEPWQYVIGKEWFYDIELKVTADTLIPRPETEELVHLILKNHTSQNLSVLDIGTGSGCIPIALKFNRPTWKVQACDISEKALKVAVENAKAYNLEIRFYQDDILNTSQNQNEKLDIIVSNPPYIPIEEKDLMHENVLMYEPHTALFVENKQPLIFYERIALYAKTHLNKGGHLYFELNEYNASRVKNEIESQGFTDVTIHNDLMGKQRMLSAVWQ
ncbi:MAG: peptide chain release factor N(5)-glutamine methyltransferase [Chitinophagales bacterium]|nr:peptide chain release factor N(5)-glutamine methyltransferase [Chitinophagales bacterium]